MVAQLLALVVRAVVSFAATDCRGQIMPPGIAEVEAQALQLTPEERVRLADRLLSSLSTDVSVEEAWSAEVDHRIAELEAGSVNPVPIEDALARARRAIR